ncbi:MAG: mechanosensitive ion channel family protein [Bacteroidetes bacterium]|nr:MAG: mechanosensitive ion channel family protein [Bacteroidota bacterium]
MKVLYTVIFAIALIVLLRGANYFLTLITHQKNMRTYVLRIFPWIEVVLWTVYVFWAIHYWFHDLAGYMLISATIAIVLILLMGWYVFRDIISGAVLRSDNNLEPGLKITTDNLSGTITSLGFISLEITSADGERVNVPYSKITGQSIAKRAAKGQGKSQSFKIHIPRRYGALNIEKRLKRKILELPWVIAEGDIKISMKIMGEVYETEISFYTIKEEMLNQTEEIIRDFANDAFETAKTK